MSTRLVLLNVHGWRDAASNVATRRVRDLLVGMDADLIALNEVKHPHPFCEYEADAVVTVCTNDGAKRLCRVPHNASGEAVASSLRSQLGLASGTQFALRRKSDGVTLSGESLCAQNLPHQQNPRDQSGKYEVVGDISSAHLASDQSVVAAISTALPNMQFHFAPALDETFGNMLFAKWEPTFHSHFSQFDPSERRSVVRASFPAFDVFVLHLDHKKENVRLGQLNDLLSAVANSVRPHVVVGDFNAIDFRDYDQPKRDEIDRLRAAENWEPAESKVVDFMEKQGYVDCWRVANPEALNPSTNAKTNTRIDYCFVKGDITVRKCDIQQTDVSDHAVLMLEFNVN